MTNSSILAAFERMWQHITTALSYKAERDEIPTSAGDISAVSYTTQILTESEKKQARKNIGVDDYATQSYVDDAISGIEIPDADFTEHIENTVIHVSPAEKETWNKKSNFSGSYNDLTDKPEAMVQIYTWESDD